MEQGTLNKRLPANVWLLTGIQSLAMSAGAMMVLIGGLLGAQLAPKSELSTLPVALLIIGTACGVVPVTRLMAEYGRKPVFFTMSLVAMMGALLAAFTSYQESFYGFLLASFLIGLSIAGFQQIRFAAMESVDVQLAPKAASTVLLGGLIAAFLGPELVTLGGPLTSNPYTGAFLLMAALLLICAVMFLFIAKAADVKHSDDANPQDTLASVVRHPKFVIALSASVVGYGLMSFIMTATPVHMHVLEHHSLEHTKWVIQSHIVAMFLPSFISGWLISRLGVKWVIISGIVIYLLTIVMALSGTELLNYWVALVLLGIGWNFMFLGGTILLTSTHGPQHRFKVQGLHDFLVFTAQAIASLGAGVILYAIGWKGLLYVSLGIIAAQVMVLFWQSSRNKKLNTLHEVTNDS